ncbi:hypothetical protein [Pseudoalteromonas luteoviolacea]|uniref:Uncharacterized protein n=1 Tax=Pseudoalteromonas luteoviolacea NCIMB 1942 TaxID=1365253 RepID=A0A166XSU7_9GAMM|nr:hypothetical protein [Pseudoalteromonas luteoviolacea]KZN40876.1 hypothetical protein N482_20915 [Pseudoalteromonas luteoviolacea NCIMB 1942]KZX00399.1 hypothetical protein JL49_11740 [Pseudoalteromonas luteoviolacea]
MKTAIITIVLLAFSAFIFTPNANAHGSTKPLHGGVVKVEHEMVFELVRAETSVSLYLRDHGKPYSAEKVTGNIIVLANGKKSDAQLRFVGDNKLTANIAIADGAKVLVKVKESSHHSVTVRFTF